MARFDIPNSASLHTARSLFAQRELFAPGDATLRLHPRWNHAEPVALAAIAAWGAYWAGEGAHIEIENLERGRYLARMKVFDALGVAFPGAVREREEAGRFLPVTRVANRSDVPAVIGSISALLHLDGDREALSAVQYCVSELLRNALEHADSPSGAFVCAQRYAEREGRVTIAVADCGQGIARHLGRRHAEARASDRGALGLALRPGVTGALPTPYGTAENAGAGLFVTRCIAKGTGGYFFLMSGDAAYRLRRTRRSEAMLELFTEAFDDPRHDLWTLPRPWVGTVASLEIVTERIGDFAGFMSWIVNKVPRRTSASRRIRFT